MNRKKSILKLIKAHKIKLRYMKSLGFSQDNISKEIEHLNVLINIKNNSKKRNKCCKFCNLLNFYDGYFCKKHKNCYIEDIENYVCKNFLKRKSKFWINSKGGSF